MALASEEVAGCEEGVYRTFFVLAVAVEGILFAVAEDVIVFSTVIERVFLTLSKDIVFTLSKDIIILTLSKITFFVFAQTTLFSLSKTTTLPKTTTLSKTTTLPITRLRQKENTPREDARGREEIARLKHEPPLLRHQSVEEEMLVGEQHGDAAVGDGEVEHARVLGGQRDGLQVVRRHEHVRGEKVERCGGATGGGSEEDERVGEPAGGGDELIGLGDSERRSERRPGRWRRPTGRWPLGRRRGRCR